MRIIRIGYSPGIRIHLLSRPRNLLELSLTTPCIYRRLLIRRTQPHGSDTYSISPPDMASMSIARRDEHPVIALATGMVRLFASPSQSHTSMMDTRRVAERQQSDRGIRLLGHRRCKMKTHPALKHLHSAPDPTGVSPGLSIQARGRVLQHAGSPRSPTQPATHPSSFEIKRRGC